MKFIYIDSTHGNDENDGLTRNNAVETLSHAIDLADTGDVLAMLPSTIVYSIANIGSLLIGEKDIILVGTGYAYETTLQLNTWANYLASKNNLVVANCIMKLSDTSHDMFFSASGYNKDEDFSKRFYNVIFTQNKGGYPNIAYFSCCTSVLTSTNFRFMNCTFYHWVVQYPIRDGYEYIDKCVYVNPAGIAKNYLPQNANNLLVNMSDFNSDYTINGNPAIGHTNYDALIQEVPEVAGLFLDTLIKTGSQYYSIHQSCYDTAAKTYTPLLNADFDNYGFYINDLLKEITVNEETFKPIDKFSRFSIVCKNKKPIELYGIKNKAEMVAATENIDLSISSKINSMTLTSKTAANGNIRLAFSLNNSADQKWYTVTDGTLTELNITIPLKKPSFFTVTDQQQWDKAADTIQSAGLTPDDFNMLNFNELFSSFKSIRFAYVLYRPGYEDEAAVQNLEWNFNAKGTMKKMKDTEYDVDLYEHSAKVTTLIENDIIKVNIMI